jgi:nucleoside 2-deoxyribosyltransferase
MMDISASENVLARSGINAFFAYPAVPAQLGETIERTRAQLKATRVQPNVTSWTALDIAGHFISSEVETKISEIDFFVADVTFLNFNVTYEIGYAIGKGKRVYTVRNKSFQESYPTTREVGLFDNLGYKEYSNSEDLRDLLKGFGGDEPIDLSVPLNQKAPVYLIETKHKTDWISRVVSRVKKARYTFRNFDPNESPRLSAYEAVNQVAQSYGVLVPLLSSMQEGAAVHNLRAAFVAGLAAGLAKPLCIIQQGDGPIPLDVRDIADTAQRLDDINEIVGEFAARVAEAFQEGRPSSVGGHQTFLSTLDLGASSAENEMRTLQNYYLNTEAFLKALRGEAHLVVGRKGSGKSAIFLQIRDRERSRDPSQNIVLDLKPEGYKLLKFKELILQFMQEGTLQHTITAFWNYVLLLEICYKILEKDRQRHLNNHNLFESYKRLEDLYNVSDYFSEGDFSERIGSLIDTIGSKYDHKYGGLDGVRLDSGQITKLLYQHDIRKLENELAKYMRQKGVLWLLFDNVDKGWPTSGLKHEDLIIIRCLIDAARKVEREFSKLDVDVNTVVFLRNDVY